MIAKVKIRGLENIENTSHILKEISIVYLHIVNIVMAK